MKLFFTSALALLLILTGCITLAETSTPTTNAAPTTEISCAGSLTDITATTLTRLTLATWNVGVFNNGEPPIGMPDDSVEANLPKIKSLITSFEADILIITEYASFLNQGKNRNTYDEVLKQFLSIHPLHPRCLDGHFQQIPLLRWAYHQPRPPRLSAWQCQHQRHHHWPWCYSSSLCKWHTSCRSTHRRPSYGNRFFYRLRQSYRCRRF